LTFQFLIFLSKLSHESRLGSG